ncbi:hypothetical protein C8046_14710 [Serinibacter arcticus]|uniref:Lipoprotein n=1 Tax=Serinibacter arcticus TaxID=1655435 RepID=A0A2U1ZXL5_9MICO|nr:hypothetical protein [Serinibacter arcticus]PWD51711.1 hypothetical protein C8046_14710 [Serinibacter arcticus]
MRTRRTLLRPAGVCLVLALAACGAPGASEPGTSEPSASEPAVDANGLLTIDGSVALTCGGGTAEDAFPASALDGQLQPSDPAGLEAALDALAAEAGMDAPPALQGTPASDAAWFVLRETADTALVAVGDWGPDGPRGPEDMSLGLERVDGGWKATGWGGCRLMPALAEPWTFWTALGAPETSPDDVELALQVVERSCTGGREPDEYLHEPVVVETDEAVTIYWTSGYFVNDPPADDDDLAWTCPGNPSVTRTVTLGGPLGDRTVLDGSVWPAEDVRDREVDPSHF